MKKILLVILPFCLFGQYFIRVDQGSRRDIPFLSSLGITSVDYFGNSLLALSDERGLDRLAKCRIDFQVLDDDPSAHRYFMVWSEERNDQEELARAGDIILQSGDCFLVRLDDDHGIEILNRLQVVLKKLTFQRLVVASEKEGERPGIVNKDTLIQEMANRVSQDTVLALISRLQNFRTRYSSTDSARACANWLRNKFMTYGFDSVYTETFSLTYAPNVIAVKRGMVYPGRMYVVGCGHYDCTSGSPTTFAPGANDDGSGTAMVMEAARVLRNYRFEYSIRLMAFGGEEQGLLGSEYYAQRARSRSDSIRGVVNGDMFAYTTPNRDTLYVINDTTYRNNLWLANYFATCADTYTTLKKRVWSGRRSASDHASFGRYGYPAIQERENLNVTNPYYHTTGDTIGGGFNAVTMCYQGVRAAVATIASLAIPYRTHVGEENREFAADFKLEVYPTVRVRKHLKLSYVLPRPSRVELLISNVLGQIITSRIVDWQRSGTCEIELGHGLSGGIYFLTCRIEQRIISHKLVLLNSD